MPGPKCHTRTQDKPPHKTILRGGKMFQHREKAGPRDDTAHYDWLNTAEGRGIDGLPKERFCGAKYSLQNLCMSLAGAWRTQYETNIRFRLKRAEFPLELRWKLPVFFSSWWFCWWTLLSGRCLCPCVFKRVRYDRRAMPRHGVAHVGFMDMSS